MVVFPLRHISAGLLKVVSVECLCAGLSEHFCFFDFWCYQSSLSIVEKAKIFILDSKIVWAKLRS